MKLTTLEGRLVLGLDVHGSSWLLLLDASSSFADSYCSLLLLELPALGLQSHKSFLYIVKRCLTDSFEVLLSKPAMRAFLLCLF